MSSFGFLKNEKPGKEIADLDIELKGSRWVLGVTHLPL